MPVNEWVNGSKNNQNSFIILFWPNIGNFVKV